MKKWLANMTRRWFGESEAERARVEAYEQERVRLHREIDRENWGRRQLRKIPAVVAVERTQDPRWLLACAVVAAKHGGCARALIHSELDGLPRDAIRWVWGRPQGWALDMLGLVVQAGEQAAFQIEFGEALQTRVQRAVAWASARVLASEALYGSRSRC